ncbi:hypothetical protein K504DRAFT_172195 [Pleomassaria siparia CBS 279.74]|uniref:Uncharacterized protein n=1 Tax=Pleomassaria siparia CBS 279.74 TaxID=1314801 RepID=A0A6G1JTF9_9PLEO|nr:hypothetical protein K504DRAFT_172195 [Pleomassaria siparia CBS 279.74]
MSAGRFTALCADPCTGGIAGCNVEFGRPGEVCRRWRFWWRPWWRRPCMSKQARWLGRQALYGLVLVGFVVYISELSAISQHQLCPTWKTS